MGVILCNARAKGEFGAVSVVSGHIRGQTNTMPLHIEILYNDYQFAAHSRCVAAGVPGRDNPGSQIVRRVEERSCPCGG
jgi:ABC-type molybdate transport system permease subunit